MPSREAACRPRKRLAVPGSGLRSQEAACGPGKRLYVPGSRLRSHEAACGPMKRIAVPEPRMQSRKAASRRGTATAVPKRGFPPRNRALHRGERLASSESGFPRQERRFFPGKRNAARVAPVPPLRALTPDRYARTASPERSPGNDPTPEGREIEYCRATGSAYPNAPIPVPAIWAVALLRVGGTDRARPRRDRRG